MCSLQAATLTLIQLVISQHSAYDRTANPWIRLCQTWFCFDFSGIPPDPPALTLHVQFDEGLVLALRVFAEDLVIPGICAGQVPNLQLPSVLEVVAQRALCSQEKQGAE